MLLSNIEIQREVDEGLLVIEPFDKKYLELASYDLRVGKEAATIPQNGDPKIDIQNEGFVVIDPYSATIVCALEYLKLPLNLAGRLGLKSGLSRRGIYASVGPQVYPGYDGKLSVTLFNLAPVPVVLNYQDPFLCLELHRLGKSASRGNSGNYPCQEKPQPKFKFT